MKMQLIQLNIKNENGQMKQNSAREGECRRAGERELEKERVSERARMKLYDPYEHKDSRILYFFSVSSNSFNYQLLFLGV